MWDGGSSAGFCVNLLATTAVGAKSHDGSFVRATQAIVVT